MIKIVKCELQFPYDQYKRYTDAEKKVLKIEKSFDSPWASWEVRIPSAMSSPRTIVSSHKLDDIKKFLSQFNSVEELVGTWFINGMKPLSVK